MDNARISFMALIFGPLATLGLRISFVKGVSHGNTDFVSPSVFPGEGAFNIDAANECVDMLKEACELNLKDYDLVVRAIAAPAEYRETFDVPVYDPVQVKLGYGALYGSNVFCGFQGKCYLNAASEPVEYSSIRCKTLVVVGEEAVSLSGTLESNSNCLIWPRGKVCYAKQSLLSGLAVAAIPQILRIEPSEVAKRIPLMGRATHLLQYGFPMLPPRRSKIVSAPAEREPERTVILPQQFTL